MIYLFYLHATKRNNNFYLCIINCLIMTFRNNINSVEKTTGGQLGRRGEEGIAGMALECGRCRWQLLHLWQLLCVKLYKCIYNYTYPFRHISRMCSFLHDLYIA